MDYHYSVFQKNPTWIAEAKTLGLITNSWTVNDAAVYDELKKQASDLSQPISRIN
jgi:glycerophosphoryl diester phosphodiesterase